MIILIPENERKRGKLSDQRDIRFFPVFLGATLGVLLEIIATLIDEIITGNLFTDAVFASVNLITPYTLFEVCSCWTIPGICRAIRRRKASLRMSTNMPQGPRFDDITMVVLSIEG